MIIKDNVPLNDWNILNENSIRIAPNINPVPARMTTVGGSTPTTYAVTLAAGETAEHTIQFDRIPETLYLYLEAETYPVGNTVQLQIIATNGTYYSTIVPIDQNSSGICTATFKPKITTAAHIKLTINAVAAINITSISLLSPMTPLDEVELQVPGVFNDYDAGPISVQQTQVNLASLSLSALKDTSLLGSIILTCTTTVDSVLSIYVKADTVDENYAPLVYRLSAGVNSISAALTYLNKEAGEHIFAIYGVVSTGTAFIEKISFTLSGGNTAV